MLKIQKERQKTLEYSKQTGSKVVKTKHVRLEPTNLHEQYSCYLQLVSMSHSELR